MAVKIRMARGGAKNRPHYSIMVADSRKPRDGKFIEKVGIFDPLLPKDNKARLVLKQERIEDWLSKGAVPSLRVSKILKQNNIGQNFKQVKEVNSAFDARVELKKEEIAAKKKAEAEAAAKAEAEAKAKAEEEAKAKAAEEAAKAEAEKAAAEAKPAEENQGEETPQGEAKKEEAPAAEAPKPEAEAASPEAKKEEKPEEKKE